MRRTMLLAAVAAVAVCAIGIGANAVASSKASDPNSVLAAAQAMYSYGYELDSGTVDGLMALFSEDARAHYSFPGGTFDLPTKQAIRDFLGPFTGTGGMHSITNPVVEAQGTGATGKFYLWRVQPAPVDCPGDGEVGWIVGYYEVDFVRSNGRWLIEDLWFDTESQGTFEGCNFVGAP